MKLMRILGVGLMMVGVPAVAAQAGRVTINVPEQQAFPAAQAESHVPSHVNVVAEPGQAPESALSPQHSPVHQHSPAHHLFNGLKQDVLSLSQDQDNEDDDGSEIGTSTGAALVGEVAEDQLQSLVDEWYKEWPTDRLRGLRTTFALRPGNFRKIIEAVIQKAELNDTAFDKWFEKHKDDEADLEVGITTYTRRVHNVKINERLHQLEREREREQYVVSPANIPPVPVAMAVPPSATEVAQRPLAVPEDVQLRSGFLDKDGRLLTSDRAATAVVQPQAASAPSATEAAKLSGAKDKPPLKRQNAGLTLADLPGFVQKPKSSWQKAAWFGAGAGMLAAAAAVIYYFWIKPTVSTH